jgi:hypothetical protein
MTILLQGQVFLAEALAGTTELSSRPERSVVEGPAVFFPLFHKPSLALTSLGTHGFSRQLHGFDDGRIRSAAAEMRGRRLVGKGVLDLHHGRIRILL